MSAAKAPPPPAPPPPPESSGPPKRPSPKPGNAAQVYELPQSIPETNPAPGTNVAQPAAGPPPLAVPLQNGHQDQGEGADHDGEEKDGPVQETQPLTEAVIASQVMQQVHQAAVDPTSSIQDNSDTPNQDAEE